MHRQPLLKLLEDFTPTEAERVSHARTVELVKTQPLCFERSLAAGHITASALVVDEGGMRALLVHHKKLDRWLQPGGHADGDPDVLAVAMREVREETGLTRIEPVHRGIFDVDVHPMPARPNEPGHDHYDVRFLLRATGDEAIQISDESHAAAWFEGRYFDELRTDDSVCRLWRKWLAGTHAGERQAD